ncbi:substrate-binding domain-containing protein [Paenibacillus humicus]|uniref:substrate-binding domain-containing protein n=1 Tax=Paenibacillus humicus TaxID=412861 RepID=UPI003F1873BF
MRTKRLWLPLLLLGFVVLVVWTGLGRGEASPEDNRIAIIMKTTDANSHYWQTVRSGALAAAKELEVALELSGPLRSIDSDEQARLLEKAIEQRPRAIVLAPIDEDALAPQLEEISRLGIRLIIMDTPLLHHRADSYVSSDHVEEGREAAGILAPGRKTRPVYAFLTSDEKSPVAMQRRNGVLEALPAGSAYNLGMINVGKSEEQAYRTVKSLTVAYPGMNGIIALTDIGVAGAAKALKETGLSGSVKLIGFDSSVPEIQLLEQGAMHALIVQNPFNMGFLGVQAALDSSGGSATVDIPSATITRANMYAPENQKLLFPFVY